MNRKHFFFYLAWFLIIAGAIITIIYLVLLFNDGWCFWGDTQMNIEKSGQFGDYIGGFIGTIFSLSGFIFLYLTLKEQRIAFQKERFESKFYELIRLHRENTKDMEYSKFERSTGKIQTSNSRKVFEVIFKEFIECYQELIAFHKMYECPDFINVNYKGKLNIIINRNGLKVTPIQIALIDIAYCIVFFGVSKHSEPILQHLFRKKYDNLIFYKIIKYFQLKCNEEIKDGYKIWLTFYSKRKEEKYKIFEEIYKNRRSNDIVFDETFETKFIKNLKEEKYYNGHQHRLGHYFRHLFQSFKFLNDQDLNRENKYFYAKTFRAQLSTFEQTLLFINSLSSLGLRWELNPEIKEVHKMNEKQKIIAFEKAKLISNFHLIKNMPGTHVFKIRYHKFYPKVKYESYENQ